MKNNRFNLRALLISCFLFVGLAAFAQTTVQGTVLDAANGEPIIGASILEIGTTNGTITDWDGNFTLTVQSGAKLAISYMGYALYRCAVPWSVFGCIRAGNRVPILRYNALHLRRRRIS